MKAFNLSVKAAFAALVAVVLVQGGLPQFEGKGMAYRVALYVPAAFVVPLLWRLRLRHLRYPHGADALFALPFVVDLLGNAANLFDRIRAYDDAAHFANWAFLAGAGGVLISHSRLPRLVAFALVFAMGSVVSTLWEVGEYLAMRTGVTRLHLTYEDTIADLALSLAGSFAGAGLSALRTARGKRKA